MNIRVKQNYIWSMLDEGSQLWILSLLLEQGFTGNVTVIGKPSVKEDGSIPIELYIEDENEHSITLPINMLDILNN